MGTGSGVPGQRWVPAAPGAPHCALVSLAGAPGRRAAAVAASPHGGDGERPAAVRRHALDQGRLGFTLPQLPAGGYQVGWRRGAGSLCLHPPGTSSPRPHPAPPLMPWLCLLPEQGERPESATSGVVLAQCWHCRRAPDPLPIRSCPPLQAGPLGLGPPLTLHGLGAHLRHPDGLSPGCGDARLPRGDPPGPLLLDTRPRPGLPRRCRAGQGSDRG